MHNCACPEVNACEWIFVNMEEDSAQIHQCVEQLLPSKSPSLQSSESESWTHLVRNKAHLKRLCRRLVASCGFWWSAARFRWDRFPSAAHLVITTNVASTSSWFEAFRLRCMQEMEMLLIGLQGKALISLGGSVVGWFQDWRSSHARNACLLPVVC